MSTSRGNSVSGILRFGIFEVDLAAGELRKNGARIRLQDQPFQLLSLLVQEPGKLVTREDIRARLWPQDTFVDFDHSLNTAVNKVREALGDSASSPRFLETVPRRGYRFLAPVESVSPAPPFPEAPLTAQPFALHPELHVPAPHRGLTRALFALTQVMYVIFYLEALFHLSSIDRIVDTFLPAQVSLAVFILILITAVCGIPLRCYLLSAIAFDYRGLREKFQKLFLFILVLDELWALSPFLLAARIGFGTAFAATAALLYVPFSERTLVRLAYLQRD